MENKGLIIGGSIAAALLISGGIYLATRKKTDEIVAVNTGDHGGSSAPPKETPIQNALANAQIIAGLVSAFTAEKFPLRVGMKGPNVKKMQDALRGKFNQLAVKSDGLFGVKTFQALKDIGYATLAQSTIPEETFNKILAGEKKSTAVLGADGRTTVIQGNAGGRIKVSGGTGAGPKRCFDTDNGKYVPCPQATN